jgi:plasmid maintenance system antidote protein VapI
VGLEVGGKRQRKPLTTLIRDRGFRVSWVAWRCGVSGSLLSRIASGERRLSPELAQRLAEVIGCQVDEVIAAAEAGK